MHTLRHPCDQRSSLAMSAQVMGCPRYTASPQVPMHRSLIGAFFNPSPKVGGKSGVIERGKVFRSASVSRKQVRVPLWSLAIEWHIVERHSSSGCPDAINSNSCFCSINRSSVCLRSLISATRTVSVSLDG